MTRPATIDDVRAYAATVAVHESGHAVCAALLGLPLAYVTTVPDADHLAHAALAVPLTEIDAGDALMFTLAGPAAGRRYCTRIHQTWQMDAGDMPVARDFVEALVRGAALDVRLSRCAPLTPPPPLDVQTARALAIWDRRAVTLVEAHWPWIERVAFRLTDDRTLTATDVRELRESS